MRMDKDIKTIDQYIHKYSDTTQVILENIRQKIHGSAPGAKEKISYGIPTFTLNGKNLVHFAAYENHIGFYPGPEAIRYFAAKLGPYEIAKGTVRFPIDKPIPLDLIQKIIKYRVKQYK